MPKCRIRALAWKLQYYSDTDGHQKPETNKRYKEGIIRV